MMDFLIASGLLPKRGDDQDMDPVSFPCLVVPAKIDAKVTALGLVLL